MVSSKKLRATPHLGFSQQELQVSAAQDAVVLDVAGQIDGAGTVHRPVDLRVAVDDVQVPLLTLQQRKRVLYVCGDRADHLEELKIATLWGKSEPTVLYYYYYCYSLANLLLL